MTNLRAILYLAGILFLLCLSGAVVWLSWSVSKIADSTVLLEAQVVSTLRDGQGGITASLERFNAATDAWGAFSQEQLALFRNPKTQQSIGLFLRSGDDLNRAVKRFNGLLDDVRDTVKATNANLNGPAGVMLAARTFIGKTDLQVNGGALPALTRVLDETTGAVVDLRIQIAAGGANFGRLTTAVERTANSLNALLEGPVMATAASLDRGTAAGADLVERLARPAHWAKTAGTWLFDRVFFFAVHK